METEVETNFVPGARVALARDPAFWGTVVEDTRTDENWVCVRYDAAQHEIIRARRDNLIPLS